MAQYNSRLEGGSSQLDRNEKTELRQEDAELEPQWEKRSNRSKQELTEELILERTRCFEGSETSSNDTGPEIEESQSIGVAVFPSAITTILPWRTDAMSSEASLNSYHTTFEIPSEGFQGSFGVTDEIANRSQAPSSPRFNLKNVQEDHTLIAPSGPLGEFFARPKDLKKFSDDPRRLEEDWNRLQLLRANVLRLRNEARKKRMELQEKELARDVSDDLFMKSLREHFPGKILTLNLSDSLRDSHPMLATYFRELQAARDACGPLRYNYNILEDRLDAAEFEMAEIEGRFYSPKGQDSAIRESGLPSLELSPLDPPEALRDLSSDASEEYHPLHAALLSRLGDLDIARERHQNLIQEREDILSLQEGRAPLGIEISEEDHEFLLEFPKAESSVLKEILDIERDVERCRAECLQSGIDIGDDADESYYESDQKDQYVLVVKDDINLREPRSDNHNKPASMYNELLLKPAEDQSKLRVLITDFVEGDKSDRINRWILHQLRISPLEIELLVRVSFHVLQLLEHYEWQRWVLSLWYRDAANIPPEAFKPPRTASCTRPSTIISRGRSAIRDSKSPRKPKSPPSFPHRRIQSCPTTISLEVIPKALMETLSPK